MANDPKKRWFLWGMVLAWTPSVPIIIEVLDTLREKKATGLGAVAGGFAEVYLTFGLILTFAFLVGGIVLLGKSFSGEHRMRTLLSVVSMCWSASMLFIFGLLIWLFFVHLPHRASGPQ
jgi:hypothetical protein